MKRLAKTVMTLAATMVIFVAAAKPVFADGLTVSADKETYETGDRVTIVIDASSVGDGSVPPDVQVEFDANRLNFEACSIEYGGGGGGLVTFKDKSANIEFTTLSGGDATVTVTATADDAASPETATVTISVNGEDTAALLSTTSTDTGVAPGTIDAGDGRVVQTVFADEFKPVLFHKETTQYKGQTVECAKFDMGDMTVLYTTDASGNDGKFMILDPATGEMSELRMIMGIENRFIIVLNDCEGDIPAGYTKAVLEWDGQTLTAFMEESVAAGTAQSVDGVNPGDFFLVYAMSSEGNKGWYRYDKNEGTYQRFVNEGGAAAEGGVSGDSDEGLVSGILDEYIPTDIQSILLIVFAPLVLILLITVIILAVKLHDYAEDLDAFYEDYYADEEEDEQEEDDEEDTRYVRRTAKPGAVTAASLVGKSMADEEDEEDEDDEDEEDAEDAVEPDDEEDEEPDEERVRSDRYERDEEDDEDEEDEEDEEDVKYYKPLTRKERKELEREEKWRLREEKKAAKRRAQGYEEATPMDWSTFEKERNGEEEAPKKAPLPPRKKSVVREESEEVQRPAREEDVREKQRRLFEQQQRIEEQRRIEKERQEDEQKKAQQMFIESKDDGLDLDEDFQFEFLNLND